MKKSTVIILIFSFIALTLTFFPQITAKAQINEEDVMKLYELIPYPDVYNVYGIFIHDENILYPNVQKITGDTKYNSIYGLDAINRIIIKHAMEYFKIKEPVFETDYNPKPGHSR